MVFGTQLEVTLGIVERLSGSAVYQLSTAGQELFHTNMLFWLARERPRESEPVWRALGIDPPVPGGVDPIGSIRREWKHVDLFIDTGLPGHELVLENKVLAVPDRRQLSRYHEQVAPHVKGGDLTHWWVLSLIAPSFPLPEPWRAIAWSELVKPLSLTRDRLGGDEAAFLGLYVKMVTDLVDLAEAVDPVANMDWPLRLDPTLDAALSQARLKALVLKLQMSRCAELLEQELSQRLAPDVEVGAGLSRTKGVLQFWIQGEKGRHFGWQVEGDQFRRVLILEPRRRTPDKRNETAAALHPDWFSFDGLPQTHLGANRARKPWNGYGSDFVYQYRPLDAATRFHDLIDLCLACSLEAARYTGREPR